MKATRVPVVGRRPSNCLGRAVATLLLALVLSAPALAQNKVTVVAGGLHSPRGLAFGPGGRLFVSQAGDQTVGGSILEILNPMSMKPNVRTVIGGLPRIGDPDEGEFLGVDGIAVVGSGSNLRIYGQMAESPQAIGDPAFGSLFRVNVNGGQFETVANVGSADYEWTGQHSSLWEEFPDSNPYAVLVVPGHIYVADAGANTLDEVMSDGSVRVLAYFPNEILRDAIPTCLAQGPDGALYIGTLALVDSLFLGPSAKVYRVDPAQANQDDPTATPMTVWASGLYPINGCAFGPDGSLYVSQLYTNPNILDDFGNPMGDVVRIPFNNPASHTFLTHGALSFTAGVAVGPNGSVYVADGAAYVPEGRVVRIGR